MNEITPRYAIAPMSQEAIDRVRAIEAANLLLPQTELRFEHELHAGMYARTMIVPALAANAACLITAVLIKIPTLIVSCGDALVYTGDEAALRLSGYNVIRAAAGRRQAFIAQSGFRLTMIFPTKATTVTEAEEEFTDEGHLLQSRRV